MYKCPVELGVLVIGCYGEVMETEEHERVKKMMNRLGIGDFQWIKLLGKITYSVAVAISNILVRHVGENDGDPGGLSLKA